MKTPKLETLLSPITATPVIPHDAKKCTQDRFFGITASVLLNLSELKHGKPIQNLCEHSSWIHDIHMLSEGKLGSHWQPTN